MTRTHREGAPKCAPAMATQRCSQRAVGRPATAASPHPLPPLRRRKLLAPLLRRTARHALTVLCAAPHQATRHPHAPSATCCACPSHCRALSFAACNVSRNLSRTVNLLCSFWGTLPSHSSCLECLRVRLNDVCVHVRVRVRASGYTMLRTLVLLAIVPLASSALGVSALADNLGHTGEIVGHLVHAEAPPSAPLGLKGILAQQAAAAAENAVSTARNSYLNSEVEKACKEDCDEGQLVTARESALEAWYSLQYGPFSTPTLKLKAKHHPITVAVLAFIALCLLYFGSLEDGHHRGFAESIDRRFNGSSVMFFFYPGDSYAVKALVGFALFSYFIQMYAIYLIKLSFSDLESDGFLETKDEYFGPAMSLLVPMLLIWQITDLFNGVWAIKKGLKRCQLSMVIPGILLIFQWGFATYTAYNFSYYSGSTGFEVLINSVTIFLIMDLDEKMFTVANAVTPGLVCAYMETLDDMKKDEAGYSALADALPEPERLPGPERLPAARMTPRRITPQTTPRKARRG